MQRRDPTKSQPFRGCRAGLPLIVGKSYASQPSRTASAGVWFYFDISTAPSPTAPGPGIASGIPTHAPPEVKADQVLSALPADVGNIRPKPSPGVRAEAVPTPAPVISGALLSGAAVGEIGNYSLVTAKRLASPEPGNWMLYCRTYDGQGYSPLDKINSSNVKNLVPVWTFPTGVLEGHEAPPIVNNGIMFVATPMNQVIALDAKTGERIWRYKRQLPEDLVQLHPTSCGVGLWQDRLYLATTDDHLVALNAKTGQGGLGPGGPGLPEGPVHDVDVACHQRQGAGRRLGRGIWRARLCRRLRRQ
jgi:hypothetical protein